MKIGKTIFTILSCGLISCNAQKSIVWNDYVEAKKSGTEHVLPDFSFAGYKYSEVPIPEVDYKIFNVTKFGAIANDKVSDKKAINKTIAAASANGEGIVFFPKGKYIINSAEDDQSIIKITTSKIVFRGEGTGANGTVLFFDKDLPPADPKKLWTCPSAIQTTTQKKDSLLAKVVGNAKRETYNIEVDNAASIKKGDWVILKVLNNSKELISNDLGALRPEPKWISILEKGVQVNERHQVQSVSQNVITFIEPIHYDVQSKHGWEVFTFEHLHHIGFENITFEGNWTKEFVHHRSAQDDGGWKILKIESCVDSWIKDCTFKNVNVPASFSSSAASTALNINITGKVGHSSVHAAGGSTGILLANVNDSAGMHHTTGVGGGSTTGTVIWRSKHPTTTSFESHASQPRTTLFDNVEGGFFKGRAGGAVKNLPNHGRHLVLWNYKETDNAETDFKFVATDSPYWRIAPPIIVGFHGSGTTFKTDEVQLLESLGTPVKPESLFEEQLSLRLGKLPDWLVEVKKQISQN